MQVLLQSERAWGAEHVRAFADELVSQDDWKRQSTVIDWAAWVSIRPDSRWTVDEQLRVMLSKWGTRRSARCKGLSD
jgi:hypothetical protein